MAKTPMWYWIVSVLLLLWALAGALAFYGHVSTGPAELAALSDYDRRFFLALPAWFTPEFGFTTGTAVLGAALLLARLRHAVLLYALSLLGVVVQFGWVLGATDLIAVKGLATAAGFPAFIFVMAVVQLVFARFAAGKGWLR